MAKAVEHHAQALALRKSGGGVRAWFRGLFSRRAARRGVNLAPADRGTIGSDGSRRSNAWYKGWNPLTEFNRLDFPTTRAFFDEIQKVRIDGKVRGAIEYIMGHQVGPAHAAYFRPRRDTQEDRRSADYCNRLFGLGGGEAKNLGLTDHRGRGMIEADFADIFRHCSDWQLSGFVLAEEIYKIAPDAGGVDRVWLRDLRPRWGGHVEGWHDDGEGRIVAATLARPHWSSRAGLGSYRLPIANDPEHVGMKGALHIAFDFDGTSDPEGRMGALLRACTGLRRLKEHCYTQLGLGLTRWGSPIPKAKLMMQLADQLNIAPDTVEKAMEIMARNAEGMKSDAGAFFAASDLVDMELIGGDFKPDGIVQTLNHINHEMLTSLFMHWLAMGVAQSHGSGAAAVKHGDAVLEVSRALGLRTCRQIERQTCARLLRANYGPRTPVPELVLPGLEPHPLAGVDIVGYSNVGALPLTDDIEMVIRRSIPGASLDFKSRTPEERAALAALARGPSPSIGGGETGGRPEGTVQALGAAGARALHDAMGRTGLGQAA